MEDFDIKKLNVQERDVIVVRGVQPEDQQDFALRLAEAIEQAEIAKRFLIVVVGDETIETLPEKKMNAWGWYRK